MQVVCGRCHTAALTAEGSAFAWEEEAPREPRSPLLAGHGTAGHTAAGGAAVELPLPAMRVARLAAAHDSATHMHAVTLTLTLTLTLTR